MTHATEILDVLRIDITHAGGTNSFDPNSLVLTFLSSPEDILALDPVGDVSEISGKPSLTYQTHEVKLLLTGEEIFRLTLRSLSALEFKALLANHGNFYEIHDDFYNHHTGEALQPKA